MARTRWNESLAESAVSIFLFALSLSKGRPFMVRGLTTNGLSLAQCGNCSELMRR